MRLISFKLENYRQYADLELRFSRDSNLVVLVGKNGAGKTNLLNALTWCIYGEEIKRKDHNSESLGLANLKALRSSSIVEVAAELTIEFDDGSQAFLKRTQSFRQTQNGSASFSPSSLKLLVKKPGAGGFAEQDSDLFLRQRMPKELESFFLFDGEKLDEYFRVSSNESVKNAVLRIAKIDILQRMIKKLDTTRKGFLGQASSDGGEDIKATNELLSALEDKLKLESEKLDEVQRSIDRSEEAYSGIEDQIRQLSAEQDKFAHLKLLQEKINTGEKDYEEGLAELCVEGAKFLTALLNGHQLVDFIGEVERRRDRRELPSVYSIETIQHVIAEGKCICGQEVRENPNAINHLMALSEEHESISRIGQVLVSAEDSVKRSIASADGFKAALPGAIEQIGRIQKSIDDDINEKIGLESELKNSPQKSTPEFLLQLRQVKEQTDEQRNNRLILANSVEDIKKEIARREAHLTQLVRKDSKNELLAKQILLTEQCLEAAEKMYNECVSSTIASVNEAFGRTYKRLIWKEMSAQASIDDAFNVSVKKDGVDHFGSLSVGENECLAFAFSIALGTVSNYELPMVVDTPLGKLSAAPQLHVCESFCEITKSGAETPGQQVILLVTDTEFNPEVAKKLSMNSPQLLTIEFDHNSDCSKVVERT